MTLDHWMNYDEIEVILWIELSLFIPISYVIHPNILCHSETLDEAISGFSALNFCRWDHATLLLRSSPSQVGGYHGLPMGFPWITSELNHLNHFKPTESMETLPIIFTISRWCMTMYDIRAVDVPLMCPFWEKKQDLGGCSMAVGQLLGWQVTFNAAGGACGRDNVWPMAAQLFQELGEARWGVWPSFFFQM